MNAIAAMFTQPKVRPGKTRLVLSGKNVSTGNDLPPMPTHEDRADAEALLRKRHKQAMKRAWDERNAERVRQYWRERYQLRRQCPATVAADRERCKAFAEANKEAAKARFRAWYLKHREKVLAKAKAQHERKKSALANSAQFDNSLATSNSFLSPSRTKKSTKRRSPI